MSQYALITAGYWGFTLTDGALRMLVLLHFHQLGYGPLAIAGLFVFYEAFGIVTNLVGGYLGARFGLNRTLHAGMALQIIALLALAVPEPLLTIAWVMVAQALSGIAKDLNKMSAKAGVKVLVSAGEGRKLYRWVAALTGSKNALKGAGFFVGATLLASLGFSHALLTLAAGLALTWALVLNRLTTNLGRSQARPRFTDLRARDPAINQLSRARLWLFAARDLWFVIALPLYASQQLEWAHAQVGAFMALWLIGYGAMQASAPRWVRIRSAAPWSWALALATLGLAGGFYAGATSSAWVIAGLLLFGALFAINSALHSYAITALARADGASLDIGFYYMANAGGRLLGTLLSGFLYQLAGLAACLLVSALLLALAAWDARAVWVGVDTDAPAKSS